MPNEEELRNYYLLDALRLYPQEPYALSQMQAILRAEIEYELLERPQDEGLRKMFNEIANYRFKGASVRDLEYAFYDAKRRFTFSHTPSNRREVFNALMEYFQLCRAVVRQLKPDVNKSYGLISPRMQGGYGQGGYENG